MQPATVSAVREQDFISTSLLTTGLIIAAVTMTFGALIAVFFYRSATSMFWGHLHVPSLLWATTVLLMASSATLEQGRRAMRAQTGNSGYRWFALTALLGLAFLVGQGAAWMQVLDSGVILAKNPHSWFIFLFVALHGLHIVIGLAGLAYVLVKTRERASGPRYQAKMQAVGLGVTIFWHYLGFLWIVLFVLLLTWRP